MYTFQFDWNGLTLPVHEATLQVVAGVDPELRWKKQGLKGHKKGQEAEKALEAELKRANEFINSEAGQEKLQSYIKNILPIFNDILTKSQAIEKHFPEHQLYFVVGPERTGGTYLLTELCNLFGHNWKKLNHRMLHDSIPTPEYLAFNDNPGSWLPLIFELAQFLYWANCNMGVNIVKKRIAFGHALDILDEIFGDRARYLVTVRHPAGIAASSEELYDLFADTFTDPQEKGIGALVQSRSIMSEAKWQEKSAEEKVLIYWELYYREVARSGVDGEKIITVNFGENSEQTVKELAGRKGISYEPESFTPRQREFSDFWENQQVTEVISRVKKSWKEHNLNFPTPSLR